MEAYNPSEIIPGIDYQSDAQLAKVAGKAGNLATWQPGNLATWQPGNLAILHG